MTTNYQIRAGAYYDSVVLMQLQKSLAGLDGVHDAGVVMATPANKELLEASGFDLTDISAKADDLLIVVTGESETAVSHALDQIDTLLTRRRSTTSHDYRPKSLKAGIKAQPQANWVLISVPGRYAAGVAEEALDAGKHVFLYSDNVSVKDEAKLKQKAAEKGLLVMGPDCGTAIINGVGLGFANRVRQGNIGLVAASGTGLQAVSTAIHQLDGGISQAIGTGGRDLKEAIGGQTAQQALALLQADEQTAVIVLISKPPSPNVAAQLLRQAQAGGKPVVVCFLGYAPPARQIGNLHFASGLTDAAQMAIQLSAQRGSPPSTSSGNGSPATQGAKSGTEPAEVPINGHIRALFSGGTLAYELLLGLTPVLPELYSNIPITSEQKLPDLMESQGHTVLDLGEDVFTQGRLHPMMDNDLRLRRLAQEAADPDVGLILLDVVLGEGSHADPASELAPAIAEAIKASKQVVAIVLGTDADPQDIEAQVEVLTAVGATTFATVNEALSFIYTHLPTPQLQGELVSLAPFQAEGLTAVNVGLESFYDSLKGQGATAVQVDWRPPAGGNEKLMAILAKMKS